MLIFNLFSANFGSADCHILIGTPKEVAAFASVRVFNVENVSLLIAEGQIMNRLKKCRKILLSAVSLKSHVDGDYKLITVKRSSNISQHFMKMNDITEKFGVIMQVYNLLKTFGGQCIVFCNVSLF